MPPETLACPRSGAPALAPAERKAVSRRPATPSRPGTGFDHPEAGADLPRRRSWGEF
jgi:hypothetical protein